MKSSDTWLSQKIYLAQYSLIFAVTKLVAKCPYKFNTTAKRNLPVMWTWPLQVKCACLEERQTPHTKNKRNKSEPCACSATNSSQSYSDHPLVEQQKYNRSPCLWELARELFEIKVFRPKAALGRVEPLAPLFGAHLLLREARSCGEKATELWGDCFSLGYACGIEFKHNNIYIYILRICMWNCMWIYT